MIYRTVYWAWSWYRKRSRSKNRKSLPLMDLIRLIDLKVVLFCEDAYIFLLWLVAIGTTHVSFSLGCIMLRVRLKTFIQSLQVLLKQIRTIKEYSQQIALGHKKFGPPKKADHVSPFGHRDNLKSLSFSILQLLPKLYPDRVFFSLFLQSNSPSFS